MSLPDFLVLGAPKSGTTALHGALAEHPQLFLSPVKEPKFFLCDGERPTGHAGPGDAHSAKEWIWRQDVYESLFDMAPPGTLKGESTPLYLGDPAAHRRIAALIPDVKLIAVLRDPVDRAYSNWTHLWSDGLEPVGDFMRACALEESRLASGWAPFWGYQRLGRYGEQLEHLLRLFPREQVHVLRYRNLVERPAESLDVICDFLGVDEGILRTVGDANVTSYVEPTGTNRALQGVLRSGASAGRHLPPGVWRTASKPILWALKRQSDLRPELDEADRRTLIRSFVDDVRLLEELTGASYDDWLAPQRPAGTYSVRRSWAPSERVAS